MRRSALEVAVCCFLLVFAVNVFLEFDVSALRQVRSQSGSGSGSNGTGGTCPDGSATPFAVALTGKVQTGSSCSSFAQPFAYPNYSFQLTPSDNSFTLNVTPVIWGNGKPS